MNILIGIIRSKFVAVLLGPLGMGVMGLLNSTLSVLTAATNFGLGTSAVRDIADADNSGNSDKVTETISIFRRLVWLTGLLGMVLTLLLSPWLSKITFGNYDYTFAFILLSITLLIGQLSVGQAALLQGLRKIKWMAKANIIGVTIGLITSLPLYYFYGIKGIVPAFIVSAVSGLIINNFYANKVKIKTIRLSFGQAFKKGNPMMTLGFMLSLAGFITIANSYFIRIFISNTGSVDDVGLFTSGFTIISTYVGMVFTAMATDYYPRLSGVFHNTEKANQLINEQAEVAILILSPLICLFMIFIQWVIIILYSRQFLPIVEMVHFAIFGIYFQGLSWAMAFLILARGDTHAFFWNELAANIYVFVFNCLGYYLDGLRGLGIGFLFGHLVYMIQIYFFISIKYQFHFKTELLKISSINVFLGLICYVVYFLLSGITMYLLGSIIIAVNAGLSLYWINKKVDFLSYLQIRLKR